MQPTRPPLSTGGSAYVTGTQGTPHGAVTMIVLLGQMMLAGGTGRTVTKNVQELVAHALPAVQVTAVVPIGKHEPDGGVQPSSTPLFTMGSG